MHSQERKLGWPRPYLRDGVPGLPIEHQRALLAAAGVDVSDTRRLYIDKLSKATIKRRDPKMLKDRVLVLMPLEPGETIYVASLRVLGWTMGDIARALLEAGRYGANVHCIDTGVTYSADMPGEMLLEALASVEDANRRGAMQEKAGRATSASQRARARRKTERLAIIRDRWHDPNYTVDQLSTEAGLSRRTLYNALGPRFDVTQTTKEALFSQLRQLTANWTIHDKAHADPIVNRCRVIGQELNDLGGADLMREAYYDAKAVNLAVTVVQAYWDGIGDWRW